MKKNFAEVGGNSIFASSIPFGECSSAMALHLRSCNGNLKYPTNVTFNECGGNEIETFHQVFKRNKDKGSLKVIPGKPTEHFNKDNGPVLSLAYRPIIATSIVTVDPAYKIIDSNKIILHGQPGTTATLKLYFKQYVASIEVELSDCPQGYVNMHGACECSHDQTPSELPNPYFYHGISRCDNKNFQAFLLGR